MKSAVGRSDLLRLVTVSPEDAKFLADKLGLEKGSSGPDRPPKERPPISDPEPELDIDVLDRRPEPISFLMPVRFEKRVFETDQPGPGPNDHDDVDDMPKFREKPESAPPAVPLGTSPSKVAYRVSRHFFDFERKPQGRSEGDDRVNCARPPFENVTQALTEAPVAARPRYSGPKCIHDAI